MGIRESNKKKQASAHQLANISKQWFPQIRRTKNEKPIKYNNSVRLILKISLMILKILIIAWYLLRIINWVCKIR